MKKSQLMTIIFASAMCVGGTVGFVAAQMSNSADMAAVATSAPKALIDSREPLQPQPKALSKPSSDPIAPVVTPSPAPPSKEMSDSDIIKAVIDRQSDRQLCSFDFDRAAALRGSEVFAKQDGIYLVKLFCWMAAYQGVSTMVKVDATQPELKITPLDFELAGFTSFDPKTQIVTNDYKYNGPGVCRELTQYHWNNHYLALVSSTVQDGRPGGCDEFGARSPHASFLITPNNVGVAQLGMTFGALKQALGRETTFKRVPLGVDMGDGMEVRQYGRVQFRVGFVDPRPPAQQDPNQTPVITDQSVIDLIMVSNPNFRTKEGVGPGTSLQDAITKYGPATLSFSDENESREYIKFAREIDPSIQIRSNQWTLTPFAGIYPKAESGSSFHQTQRYQEHAGIGSIMITKR